MVLHGQASFITSSIITCSKAVQLKFKSIASINFIISAHKVICCSAGDGKCVNLEEFNKINQFRVLRYSQLFHIGNETIYSDRSRLFVFFFK